MSDAARHAVECERTWIEGAFRPATVVVEGERIAEVLPFGALRDTAVPVARAPDVLLPGLVDTHVHLNEPGRTEWEGFSTATEAAASGGVTTLVDMPLNCIPVTTSAEALGTKLASLGQSLHVDVGFWGGVVPGNAIELTRMARQGMLGAKCFLCHSGIDDFPASTEADLRSAMPILRDAGVPLLVHAELEDAGAPPCRGDVRDYATYLASRPRAWEDRAIDLMVRLCRETRCAVHIVHLSSATALAAIGRAKDEGLPLTAETCPHYLCLRSEEVPDGATEYKCAPPIREEANRLALWEGVQRGVIDFVTSDHSPCTPGLKLPETGDFCGAWGGIASLSLGLPSVWTEARTRGMALGEVVESMSARPARMAQLSRDVGQIARGSLANLLAFDPEEPWCVAEGHLRFRHKVSPYLGRTLRGRVQTTWLRGRVVFDGREVRPGLGHAVLRG